MGTFTYDSKSKQVIFCFVFMPKHEGHLRAKHNFSNHKFKKGGGGGVKRNTLTSEILY